MSRSWWLIVCLAHASGRGPRVPVDARGVDARFRARRVRNCETLACVERLEVPPRSARLPRVLEAVEDGRAVIEGDDVDDVGVDGERERDRRDEDAVGGGAELAPRGQRERAVRAQEQDREEEGDDVARPLVAQGPAEVGGGAQRDGDGGGGGGGGEGRAEGCPLPLPRGPSTQPPALRRGERAAARRGRRDARRCGDDEEQARGNSELPHATLLLTGCI